MNHPPKTRFSHLIIVAVLVSALAVTNCAQRSAPTRPKQPGAPKPYKVMGKWYQPLADSRGFQQQGLASWYGKKFHGRKTSNGERYDMYGVSAAHKTLPLDTWVRVHNLENGKSLDVRINDRGPFVRGRIIDLSYGAAKKIDIVGPGTAKVRIVALGKAAKPEPDGRRIYRPVAYDRGNFTIQVGAFKDRYNAERFVRKLDATYVNAHMVAYNEGGEPYYRVRVGKCSTLTQAAEYENYLVRNGFPDAFTVAE
jgi:rare lipoprotein A